MSSSLFRPIINLGNSVVGVSILTMPWCFSQCGVILGTLLLILSAIFTTWTCKMLLRAAHMTRQYTYETLGHAAYDSMGKLGIEMSNIGLGIGTCVAFYIIIGDLLPPLVAQSLGLTMDPRLLRGVLLVLSAVFVAFPLTLIRNVDKLSVISVGSLAFYLFFIVQLVLSSRKHMTWEVVSGLVWWRSLSTLKCLPIFSLAFCCQSQMFVIYTSLREGSVRKMGTVVDGAVWMVTTAYLSVAMFGYLSYCTEEVHGDVLSNFPFNSLSQLTRFGFAVTVMLSFPLIVFPCRVSLNSLLCGSSNLELHVTPPIPQGRFIAITAGVMLSTLTLAILIPHIQTVLALVGATLGSFICFIFPGLFLNKVAGPNTEFSFRSKFCIVLGLCVLVLSTLVTLNSWSEEGSVQYHIKPVLEPHFPEDVVKLPPNPLPPDNELPVLNKEPNDDSHDKLQDKKDLNHDPEVQDKKDGPLEAKKPEIPLDQGDIPVIDSPDNGKGKENVRPVAVDSKEGGGDIHGKLEALAERLEKLEEENKDLKERQDEIDKGKDQDGQPVEVKGDESRHLEKQGANEIKNLEAVKDDKLDVKNGDVLKRNPDPVQVAKRADRVIDDSDNVAVGQAPQVKENVPKIDLLLEDKVELMKKVPEEAAKLPKKKLELDVAPAKPAADKGQKFQAPVADPDVEVDLLAGDDNLNVGVAGGRDKPLEKDIHLALGRDLKSA